MVNNTFKTGLWITCLLFFAGCTKYLEEKPNQSYVIPEKLEDFQSLLDNYSIINRSDPGSGEVSCDNYYLTTQDFLALDNEGHRRAYTWEKDKIFADDTRDWREPYRCVYFANTVIDNIAKVERTDRNALAWDNILGQSLFIRARYYFSIAAIFTKAYNPSSAAADLGIPLRANSDFNVISERSTLEDSYNVILMDLKKSADLLPVTPNHVVRPSRPAAYGLISRIYLAMGRYDSSFKYANLCLQIKSDLIDFNTLTASAAFPIKQFSPEVIFESCILSPTPLSMSRGKIDSTLYQSYHTNDLRKTVFFQSNGNGSYNFKGSYVGSTPLFSGIAVDEIILNRAECYARKGDKTNAMNDLNTLMIKRWKAGTFTQFSATDANDAVDKILIERRKELLMRGLRWTDLKRLNLDGRSIVLSRSINGATYTLPPNDLRYALPIPEDVINLSKVVQNPR